MHMMLFGAASIDVVITSVLYFSLFCRHHSHYHSIFSVCLCDLVYRETAGWCFFFFLLITSSFSLNFFLYFGSRLLFTYFLHEPSFARKRSFLTIFSIMLSYFGEKKVSIHFLRHFFSLFCFTFRMLYIIVLYRCVVASNSHRFKLLPLFSVFYLCLCGPFFRRLFHFYFVPTSKFCSSFSMFRFALLSFRIYAFGGFLSFILVFLLLLFVQR